MEKDILQLKVIALTEMLNSKGLITDAELEVMDKSIVETVEKLGHKKEDIEHYLGIE